MGDLDSIRNVCISGHGNSGKTTLVETVLFHCKATTRLGTVEEGTTISDHAPEEKERGNSVFTSILRCKAGDCDLHLVDTPGYPDFFGEAISGIHAADGVLIAVAANEGISAMTRKVFQLAKETGKPTGIVLTKLDAENIEFEAVLGGIRETFSEACIPVSLPESPGPGLSRISTLLDADAAQSLGGEGASWREKLVETAVETDDALVERYLEGEEIAPETLQKAMRLAVAQRALMPVFCVSSARQIGIGELVEGLVALMPSPSEVPPPPSEEGEVEVSAEGPFAARVFKSITDDYVGKMSFLRVYAGRIGTEASALLPRTGKTIRFQNLYAPHGKEQTAVPEATAGGIYTLAKVEESAVSDTFCDPKHRVVFAPIPFPRPMVGLAVTPKSRQDEQRISGALTKMADEDPTFTMDRDRQTKEMVITGLSRLHLDLKLKQLKRRFNVEVATKPPKVPYRETITAKGDTKYRHKKQTGGAGQFAEVWMRIEPLLDDEGRHEGFEYVSEVVGGAISHTFIPSIEKGIKQVLEAGPVAGYPVEGVKAIVYDGKEHPVDSKDIAFQIAGREAFKEAMAQAKPKLLEPIVNVEVSVPSRFMGDMTADLNSRRGRIQGMSSEGDLQIITAKVPLAEMLQYSTELKSMTQDEGAYTISLSHYEIVPDNVASAVIERSRREKEEKS